MTYNIKDFEQDVTSFNKIMGIPDHEGKAFNTQCEIILEELEELRWAEDQEERLDAIVDVLYTSIGLIERAKKFGYDVEGAMKAVAENNMTKFIPNDGKAETVIAYSEKFYKEEKGKNVKAEFNEEFDCFVLVDQNTGKVNKPIGYKPVDLKPFLPKQGEKSV